MYMRGLRKFARNVPSSVIAFTEFVLPITNEAENMKTQLLSETEIFTRIKALYETETGNNASDDMTAFERWFMEDAVPVLVSKLAQYET